MTQKKVEKSNVHFDRESKAKRIIVVLDEVSLEIARTKRGVELINCDEHAKFIIKMKKRPEDFRPDIVHQCLLALLDSPLNKFNKLQVILRTQKGLTIEINPSIRLPRTYKRFSGLFAQLMTKGRIQAPSGGATLLNVTNHPVHALVPPKSRYIQLTKHGHLVPDLTNFITE